MNQIEEQNNWELRWRQSHGVCERCRNAYDCPVVDMDIQEIEKIIHQSESQLLDRIEKEVIVHPLPKNWGIGNVTIDGKKRLLDVGSDAYTVIQDLAEEQRKALTQLRKERGV